MPQPDFSDYIKKLGKRVELAEKGILPSTLKMILKTHYPLPVKQQPPVPPTSDIPPSLTPLSSVEPELLEDDRIETQEKILEAADDTTEKKGKMEPERSDQNKRGKIPLMYMRRRRLRARWSLSGECSNHHELIRGRKHPDSRVSQTGRCDQ